MSNKTGEYFVVYVIGCPGSGKGTLCRMLAEEFGLYHLSVGDLLRHVVQQNFVVDNAVKSCVNAGSLVPTESLASILEGHLATQKDLGHRSFLIDGFPRCLEQTYRISAVTGKPDLVLFFDCPKQVARTRVLTRQLDGRIDNEHMFESRYREFCENNPRIVDQYRELGILIQVNTGQQSSVSYMNLMNALNGHESWRRSRQDGIGIEHH